MLRLSDKVIFSICVCHTSAGTHAYERCSPSPPPAPRSSVHPCARAPRPPRVASPPSHSPSPGTRPDPSNTYPRRMAVVSFVIPRHPPRARCADPRRPSIPSTQVIHGGPLPRREGRRRRCAPPQAPNRTRHRPRTRPQLNDRFSRDSHHRIEHPPSLAHVIPRGPAHVIRTTRRRDSHPPTHAPTAPIAQASSRSSSRPLPPPWR